MPDIILPCIPAEDHCDLPYHWVQWRTPYRQDEPQPWIWHPQSRIWTACGGTDYTPERAAALQWHYLEPAFPSSHRPSWQSLTLVQRAEITERLARLITSQQFAARFGKPIKDDLVQAATNLRWEEIGLGKVAGVLAVLYDDVDPS